MLLGKAPGRTSPDQITLMNKNWGLGIEFAAVGKLVYDRARAAGMGKEMPTEWFSQTSRP
jgi:alanine dehydrogenase